MATDEEDAVLTLEHGGDFARGNPEPWTSLESDESVMREQTTVEVCVKMVVCRKFTCKKINTQTGKVVSVKVRTEEDPAKLVDVHTYTMPLVTGGHSLTGTAHQAFALACNTAAAAATPTPGKRRPGRPRKIPSLAASPAASSSLPPPASLKQEKKNVDGDKCVEGDNEQDPGAGGGEAGHSGHTTLSQAKSALSQSQAKSGGSTEDVLAVKKGVVARKVGMAVKRGKGRPSRVIKKPRKYLDGVDNADVLKFDPDVQTADAAHEEVLDDNDDDDDVADADWGQTQSEAKKGEEEEEISEGAEGGVMEIEEGAMEGSSTGQVKECPKCGKKFTYASNCQRHIIKGTCQEEHLCIFCLQTFGSRLILEQHIDSHRDQDNPDNFRCNDCSRSYATRNGFLKHRRQGTCYKRDIFNEDGTQGEFSCDKCKTCFTTENLLALHKDKVHENPVSEYKCGDCGRMFYSKRGYMKHTAQQSCTQPYKCGVCGKQYSNKAKESYKAHMKFHLAEASGVQYQCEDCGRVYMTSIALKKHGLSHSGIKPYKCSICSKAFPMRYMVRDHERTHTGEKPFLCSLCGCPFANRGHLYRHLRSHQYGTLHKRGRPRKYPPGTHTLRLPRPRTDRVKEGEGIVVLGDGAGWLKVEGDAGGEVEIKADPNGHFQDGVEEVEASSLLGSGPTYITVHTVDPSITDINSALGDGQLQHVVMETTDGVTDNVVLQVIRDLTGATTVYQTVGDMGGASSAGGDAMVICSEGQESQVIVTSVAQASGDGPPQQIIVTAHPSKTSATLTHS